MELVKLLHKKGVFLVKGNIDKIAAKLNVSRYTIYNYLSELKISGDIKIIWSFILIICTKFELTY